MLNALCLFRKWRLYFFPLLLSMQLFARQADVVVFSYNRPLQLYAFLESLYKYTDNVAQTSVIYRCGDQYYQIAYTEVAQAFPQVKFIEQSSPPGDFKSLVLETVFAPGSSEYVALAVDDIVVADYFDFNECIQALEDANAYGFYLRLGSNILNSPPLAQFNDRYYGWQFSMGISHWGYPHTVDMALYRKEDIRTPFNDLAYDNPNLLEGQWAGMAASNQLGLCFETSKLINIPLNIVTSASWTHNLGIEAKALLEIFNKGLKMDISPFFQIKNQEPHEEHPPSYIPR